jgi:hypothetical protein
MKRMTSVGLAAAVFGFVACPLFYFAIGVPLMFPIVAAVGFSATLLLSSGFLLMRGLARPSNSPNEPRVWVVEVVAAAAVVACFVLASHAVFIENSRRFAFAATVFSIAWALCLPAPLFRRTALESRISKMPTWLRTGALLVLVSTSTLGIYSFLSLPRHLR